MHSGQQERTSTGHKTLYSASTQSSPFSSAGRLLQIQIFSAEALGCLHKCVMLQARAELAFCIQACEMHCMLGQVLQSMLRSAQLPAHLMARRSRKPLKLSSQAVSRGCCLASEAK